MILKKILAALSLTLSICSPAVAVSEIETALHLRLNGDSEFVPLPNQGVETGTTVVRDGVCETKMDGKIFGCDRVIITGLDKPDSNLNFQFLSPNDSRIIYLTERSKGTEYLKVLAVATKYYGEVKMLQKLDKQFARCKPVFDKNDVDVTCFFEGVDGNISESRLHLQSN
jgi:hypothetical protein